MEMIYFTITNTIYNILETKKNELKLTACRLLRKEYEVKENNTLQILYNKVYDKLLSFVGCKVVEFFNTLCRYSERNTTEMYVLKRGFQVGIDFMRER